ncbi:YcfA-like protein [Bacteroidales bacterium Barb6XT]|nr:YcfA-like protein [Bacteroidales bacterium Barb6XT]
MKSSEFHRLILANGWMIKRQAGSHITYTKDGRLYVAPYHGGKEIPKGTEKTIRKEMNLK